MDFSKYSVDEDGIVRLRKDLNHALKNLDSRNIKQIYTNYVDVRDETGRMTLEGSLLTMLDSSDNTRLKMGLTTGDVFSFELYDDSGNQTLYIDSNGKIIATGTVTASAITASTISGSQITGSTITGGTVIGSTIVAGTDTNNAIVLSDNKLRFLKNSSHFIRLGEYSIEGLLFEAVSLNSSNKFRVEDNGLYMLGTSGQVLFALNSSGITITDGSLETPSINAGQITGSTITGANIKTAENGNARIELSGNSLASYNASDQLNGLSISGQFMDLKLYKNSTLFFDIYDGIDYVALRLNSAERLTMGPSGNVSTTDFYLVDDNSTSLVKGKGYIDGFGKSLSYNTGTRTLSLLDANSNTISSVVINITT
jgi:hypothetical protein